MYKLQGEPSLLFDILWVMDGNNSLSRVLQRFAAVDKNASIPGASCELPDSRKVTGDMYILYGDVNKWAHKVIAQVAASEGVCMFYVHILSHNHF
jgi:hypothetical protein